MGKVNPRVILAEWKSNRICDAICAVQNLDRPSNIGINTILFLHEDIWEEIDSDLFGFRNTRLRLRFQPSFINSSTAITCEISRLDLWKNPITICDDGVVRVFLMDYRSATKSCCGGMCRLAEAAPSVAQKIAMYGCETMDLAISFGIDTCKGHPYDTSSIPVGSEI